jgi:hypothetical protein
MTFPSPKIDDRRFQDLVREALDRIPAHTPEWTHLGESDPGVTLVELFAFMAESVIYRANRVPEAAKSKFLDLLGLKLSPARPARGIVTFDPGRMTESVRIDKGTELRAGSLPFSVVSALDVVPLTSIAVVKETTTLSDDQALYYKRLYQSLDRVQPELATYRTRVVDGKSPVRLGSQTVDGALWIALLLAKAPHEDDRASVLADARRSLAGRHLSVGLAPYLAERPREIGSRRGSASEDDPTPIARVEIPVADSKSTTTGTRPLPGWKARPFRGGTSLHKGPDILEIQLPGDEKELDLSAWDDLDPLEAGVGEFPPAFDDSRLAERIVGWLRIVPSNSSDLAVVWAGINAGVVEQGTQVENEILGDGEGLPDQEFRIKGTGVVGSSVGIQVVPDATGIDWTEIDDLAAAGSEVRWNDPSAPPGSGSKDDRPVNVFAVDPHAGLVRFGDGMRGRRPPSGTKIVARYRTCAGSLGNLPAGSIKSGPDLPPDLKPSNPIPTWGGADAESLEDGSRRVPSWMRHRDRLVTAEDFLEITRSTPGTDIARVDVLPAWHPDLDRSLPGDVAGVVTVMVVPRADAQNPDRPQPDTSMLEAICAHLEPRRLVTTEIVVKGPTYVPVKVSIGITVAGGYAAPEVRDRLEARIRQYLSPVRETGLSPRELRTFRGMENGWPLRKQVNRLELVVEAAREDGVLRVDELLLGRGDETSSRDDVDLFGLELPWLSAISVSVGSAVPLSALETTRYDETGTAIDPNGTGSTGSNGGATRPRRVPVPVVPETC